jgi:hypothetical protein
MTNRSPAVPNRLRPILRAIKDQVRSIQSGSQGDAGGPPDLAPLTAGQLAEVQTFFKRKKFFIFGYPRSGKTMLARLVRIHPEVHCNWHARFFHEHRDLIQHLDVPSLEQWLERNSNHWTHDQNLTVPMIRIICDFVLERDAERAGKPIVGDETPNHNNGAAVERLQRVYPDARLLWVVRDGRDAVLFRRLQLFIDKPQSLSTAEIAVRDALREDKEKFFQEGCSIFTPAWLQQFAKGWAANASETDAAARALFGDQYLALRYEDLLTDPVAWMKRVWSFLGAGDKNLDSEIRAQVDDNADAAWHAQKDPALVDGLHSAEIEAWRRVFTPEDLVLFESLAGAELEAWGYDLASRLSDASQSASNPTHAE